MKRTLNKLMALLCTLAITMSWLPAIPVMAAETDAPITTWEETLTSGKVTLGGPVTLLGAITLSGNLTIDLNGQTLSGTAAPYFTVPSGTTLTIKDSSGKEENEYTDGTGTIQGISASAPIIKLTSGGALKIEGGIITGQHTTSSGGAISATSATIVMNGGKITGNTAIARGAVAYLQSSTFTMNGGVLSNNIAQYGGVFSTSNSANTINLFGGKITGNVAYHATESEARLGGVMYINGNANTTINIGGTVEISGNANTASTHATTSSDYTRKSALAIGGSKVNITGGTIGASANVTIDGTVYTDTTQAELITFTANSGTPSIAVSGGTVIEGKGITYQAGTATIGGLTAEASVLAKKTLTKRANVLETEVTDGHLYTHNPEAETLNETVASSYIKDGGNVVLGGDVQVSGKVTLTGDLTIDLAGHRLTNTATPFFEVPAGTKLTIKDSGEKDEEGKDKGALDSTGVASNNHYGIVYVTGGTFDLYGGKLTGHEAPDYTNMQGEEVTYNAGGVQWFGGRL